MPFPIINTPLFTDIARQQGLQNMQSLAALQDMAIKQQSLADLMQKRQQDQTMRDMIQKAAQVAVNQPNTAELSRIGKNIADLTKYGPPTEQDMKTIGDLYTQAEALPKTGFDMNKFADNLMATGTIEGIIKGMDIKKVLQGENKPFVVGKSLLSAEGKVLGTDPTFQQEQQANRQAKIDELNMRLREQGLTREQNNLYRQQLLDLKREQMNQAYGLPKLQPGYRYNQSGEVETIPGSAPYMKQNSEHAKDYQGVLAVNTKTDQAMKKLDYILSDKNKDAFNNNFGGYNAYATSLIPGETQDMGRKIESLKSDMKMAGLEMIRAGGSIGQMTEREWPIVQNMIDTIDPRMGEKAARDAFTNIKAYLDRIRSNAKDVYDTQWGNTQFHKNIPIPGQDNTAPKEGTNVPKVGDIVKGYIFLGGNPADKNRWRKQ